jgi:hypothetical protein
VRQELLTSLCGCVLSSYALAANPVTNLPGATTIATADLTAPFHTSVSWRFVIRQDPPQDTAIGTGPGYLHFCFAKENASRCFDTSYPYNALGSSNIENPTPTSREPLLVVVVDDQASPTGGARLTLIWAYNPKTDQFDQIFDAAVSKNTNGEIRVITSGPLAGYIVEAVAGGRPTYRYHITVYHLQGPGFTRIFDYDGNSRYGDGNQMAVIDAEMPEILQRLKLWKRGDPLPLPARAQCNSLVMKHGVEWCE